MSRRPDLAVALVGLNWPGYQSLALGYVRASAQFDERLAGKAGFTTLDLDSELDPWWVAYRVAGLDPDVAAFSVMCWNARAVYEACTILKLACPDTLIVLGGPEVGPIAEQVLSDNPAVDVVVRGEGEETFADLLDAVLHKGRLWRVEGVTARRDGGIFSAPDRPPIADLDSIPSPYTTGIMSPSNGSAYIETSRGCPHHCAYCYEGKGVERVRSFGDARIAADIEAVATAPGMTNFSFIDSVFNMTSARLKMISDLMAPHAARGIRLHTIEVDIERIDDEQAALLVRAGVESVETGPQTVGERALEACDRRFDEQRFRAGVAACKRVGIEVECDLIVGLPYDTMDDFVRSLDFAIDVDPGRIQFSTLHVLPGTTLWDRAEEFGLAYNPSPPHEIVRTRDMSFSDLRRAEVLGSAITAHYRARVDEPSRPG